MITAAICLFQWNCVLQNFAPEDMGKVIGRQGRIAKEIRTLVRSCAQRMGQKVL